MSRTEESRDRTLLQGIGYKEFSAICSEFQIVETATRELLQIANNPNTKERLRVDIYKWIVEMNIGKPKQMSDITLDTKEDSVRGWRVSIVETKQELEALEALKKELLSLGSTEEQIEDRISAIEGEELPKRGI